MADYKKRIVDLILQNRIEAKYAVLIRGAKWCSKTTTTVRKAASVLKMDNSETKEQNLDMARLSPLRLFKGDVPRLIDEWQLAPSLWDAVRYEVDRDGKVQLAYDAPHVAVRVGRVYRRSEPERAFFRRPCCRRREQA